MLVVHLLIEFCETSNLWIDEKDMPASCSANIVAFASLVLADIFVAGLPKSHVTHMMTACLKRRYLEAGKYLVSHLEFRSFILRLWFVSTPLRHA